MSLFASFFRVYTARRRSMAIKCSKTWKVPLKQLNQSNALSLKISTLLFQRKKHFTTGWERQAMGLEYFLSWDQRPTGKQIVWPQQISVFSSFPTPNRGTQKQSPIRCDSATFFHPFFEILFECGFNVLRKELRFLPLYSLENPPAARPTKFVVYKVWRERGWRSTYRKKNKKEKFGFKQQAISSKLFCL